MEERKPYSRLPALQPCMQVIDRGSLDAGKCMSSTFCLMTGEASGAPFTNVHALSSFGQKSRFAPLAGASSASRSGQTRHLSSRSGTITTTSRSHAWV